MANVFCDLGQIAQFFFPKPQTVYPEMPEMASCSNSFSLMFILSLAILNKKVCSSTYRVRSYVPSAKSLDKQAENPSTLNVRMKAEQDML